MALASSRKADPGRDSSAVRRQCHGRRRIDYEDEDEGWDRTRVMVHGGFLDPIDLVRDAPIARELRPAADIRLVFVGRVGRDDVDCFDQARRAASEIPGARFVAIEGQDHLGLDTAGVDGLLPLVLGLIRAEP